MTRYVELDPQSELPQPPLQNSVSVWGVGPVAPMHLGYDELILHQRELIAKGWNHIIVLADHHVLISHDVESDEVRRRAEYYEHYFRACGGLEANYVLGSEFQCRPDYVEALLNLLRDTTISQAKRHLTTQAKSSMKVASLMYPIMQCLDAAYLNANLVFGEMGQRKIYQLMRTIDASSAITRPRFRRPGVRACTPVHETVVNGFFVPTACDIAGKSLKESTSSTRISIHDDEETLTQKIRKMYAPPPTQPLAEGRKHALLECYRLSVFPWRDKPVTVFTGAKNKSGYFDSYDCFKHAYEVGEISPQDAKQALFHCLSERIDSINNSLRDSLSGWVKPRKRCG